MKLIKTFIYDLFLFSSSSYGANGPYFSSNLEFAKSQADKYKNVKFGLSDSEFKPSIKAYINESEPTPANNKSTLITKGTFNNSLNGYLIEKIELLDGGLVRKHKPIIIPNGSINSYIDYKVRYGAVYAYQVRALYAITYNAIDSDSKFTTVTSLISSRPEISYVETIENVPPPPPVELKFVWDYDRFNPNTAIYDRVTEKPLPGTGDRGSLLIHWSFPSNPQLDIKKFQVDRKSVV